MFDGLLRPVRIQAPAKTDSTGAVTGRMIADMFRNTSGQVTKTNSSYFHGNPPSGTLYAKPGNGQATGNQCFRYHLGSADECPKNQRRASTSRDTRVMN